MKLPKYDFIANKEKNYFQFISDGPKGRILKVVEFTKLENENVFNLGFGDWDEANKKINDIVVTNNGDSIKVLATVASTIYDFTRKNPKAIIFITGSTEVRTRLYRMGITNNLEEIKKDFLVFGVKKDLSYELFIIGEDYLAFFIARKIIAI